MSQHNGSGGEIQSVNESLGNHVELPESLEHCGSSSGASGTIGDLRFEGCIALGEVAVEAPDEIVATDSLKSKKQEVVSRSTMEAEYRSIADVTS
ncbi:hypothetical protein V6N11_052630 [Hibiscus sabdariffa]|uniref:Uncharacterized protein n=1 Tax=Hibiscus sabdariffa TaxID=183260 RepID=A0ABR2UAN1_9ROSI